jgi:alpha-amylase
MDVSLCFEVHQPLRLRKDFFWRGSPFRRVKPGELMDFYFDHAENGHIFNRVAEKCYLPANEIILQEIERYKDAERPFKVAYSFSGVFLEQCQRYNPAVLDSFSKLAETGLVEVMEQTYYHSLSSLYEDGREFAEQVKMHRELIWDLFGLRPKMFENTELIYNDDIARTVENMGYEGIFAEGVIASPNYVYRPQGCDRISLLLRDYQITDDVGFRFSARWWEEYPLTAEKYASWLAAKKGQCVNIFCDYETFGEHQWADTGIFDFLKFLPGEVLKWDHLCFSTPSEVIRNNLPLESISVPHTISWADLERDTSCWLGNSLQWACYTQHRRLEGPVKEIFGLEAGDGEELLRVWRYLGLSDHLYYAFTWGGGPGEVHNYFSPYGNPFDAAVTFLSILTDMHYRVKERLDMADDPFLFSTGLDQFTEDAAWSLKGLIKALEKADVKSIEYHMRRGDLSNWARSSLHDETFANRLVELEERGQEGEELREAVLIAADSRLEELEL